MAFNEADHVSCLPLPYGRGSVQIVPDFRRFRLRSREGRTATALPFCQFSPLESITGRLKKAPSCRFDHRSATLTAIVKAYAGRICTIFRCSEFNSGFTISRWSSGLSAAAASTAAALPRSTTEPAADLLPRFAPGFAASAGRLRNLGRCSCRDSGPGAPRATGAGRSRRGICAASCLNRYPGGQ